jgi:hypothetical protein
MPHLPTLKAGGCGPLWGGLHEVSGADLRPYLNAGCLKKLRIDHFKKLDLFVLQNVRKTTHILKLF